MFDWTVLYFIVARDMITESFALDVAAEMIHMKNHALLGLTFPPATCSLPGGGRYREVSGLRKLFSYISWVGATRFIGNVADGINRRPPVIRIIVLIALNILGFLCIFTLVYGLGLKLEPPTDHRSYAYISLGIKLISTFAALFIHAFFINVIKTIAAAHRTASKGVQVIRDGVRGSHNQIKSMLVSIRTRGVHIYDSTKRALFKIVARKHSAARINVKEVAGGGRGIKSSNHVLSTTVGAEKGCAAMGVKEFILNLVTLGAHARVKKVADKHAVLFEQYSLWYSKHEAEKSELSKSLLQLLEEKRVALNELGKIKDVLHVADVCTAEDASSVAGERIQMLRVEKAIEAGAMALSGSVGAGAGLASGFAAWALAGAGTASTGAAIANLNGFYQTNALLAWLGGGALQVGGGGIMIGKVVLAGICLVPTLVISGGLYHFFASKKIENIEKAAQQAPVLILEMQENVPRFIASREKAREMIETVKKSKSAFMEWHAIYRMTEEQRRQRLVTLADTLADVIKTRIFTEDVRRTDWAPSK